MPKYIANGYLVHKGVIVATGKELELTDAQAKKLGDKVTLVDEPKKKVETKKDDKKESK